MLKDFPYKLLDKTQLKNEFNHHYLMGNSFLFIGKVGRELKIDKSFYGGNLESSHRLWIEDAPELADFSTNVRVGIDYADDEWKNKQWRFIANKK